MGPPVLFEAISSPNNAKFEVCRKLDALLLKSLPVVPFASSAEELVKIVEAVKGQGANPSIFVLNSLWAEEMPAATAAVAGDAPIIVLRRMINKPAELPANAIDLPYEPACSDEVAGELARLLLEFLQAGRLDNIESYAQRQVWKVGKPYDREEATRWTMSSSRSRRASYGRPGS